MAPQNRKDYFVGGDKVDASHTGSCGIACAKGGRNGLWDEFGDSSWTGCDIVRETAEVIEESQEGFGEPETGPVRVGVAKGLLEEGE